MGKPDYVDRKKLKEAIREDAINFLSCYNGDVLALVIAEIDEIPAAELHSIDREAWEAWEACEHCGENAELTKEAIMLPLVDSSLYLFKNETWNPIEINFCPWCGRPLTNAAWEMLKKRLEGNCND